MASNANLHGTGHVVDAFHDLELFAFHFLGVLIPVSLAFDKEGSSA